MYVMYTRLHACGETLVTVVFPSSTKHVLFHMTSTRLASFLWYANLQKGKLKSIRFLCEYVFFISFLSCDMHNILESKTLKVGCSVEA